MILISESWHKDSKNRSTNPRKREKMHFFLKNVKNFAEKFGSLKKVRTFAIPNNKNGSQNAEIAQLVEHNLAKVRVASSSLVFRSKRSLREI